MEKLTSKQTPNNPYMVVENLKRDLRRRGTIKAAAEQLGVSPQTLSTQLTNAEKTYLSDRIAARLANAFGYNVEYLTTGYGSLYKQGGKRQGSGRPRYSEVQTRKNITFRLSPAAINSCKQLHLQGYQVGRIIDDFILAFARNVGIDSPEKENEFIYP